MGIVLFLRPGFQDRDRKKKQYRIYAPLYSDLNLSYIFITLKNAIPTHKTLYSYVILSRIGTFA